MNDMQALTDAFTELERRADAMPARPEKSRRPRLVPVAAAIVVAGGLVAGVAVLAPHGDAPGPVQAGAHPTTPTATLPVKRPTIPVSAKDLEDRFRTVLGGAATFTVTDTGRPVEIDGNGEVKPGSGVAIVGVLTAGGHRGGYDLQIIKAARGAKAHCDDPDQSTCKRSTLPDGSTLAVGTEPLSGAPNGITHQVDLVRKDGTEFLMHVSNERDPKGESTVLSPNPPLTTDQMVAIVTSTKW